MKKRKNWLEKFQDFWWDDLTANQRHRLWTTLTAIRGPDDSGEVGAHHVKLGTTARIRYLLLGGRMKKFKHTYWCLPFYGYVAREETAQFPIMEKEMSMLGGHFTGHIERAIRKLKPVVKKSEMKDLLEIFQEKEEKK